MNLKMISGVIAAASLLLLSGCDSDSPTSSDKGGVKEFLLTTIVGKSAYVGGFSNLEAGSINNAESYEHKQGVEPIIYKDIVLVPEFSMGDKIYKYLRGKDGNLTPTGSMDLPQASKASEISFVNENKAYVSLMGLGKLAIINPTTLKITGEVDLRSYGLVDNNPDPGVSIIREGKLYVALSQKKDQHTGYDSAYVAIIDIKTDKVEKVIIDPRVSSIGYSGHTKAFMDEKGDIYFYSHGLFGYQKGAKEGFLRIKQGEDDWDREYHFSITQVGIPNVKKSDKISYTMALEYAGNGALYAIPMVPAWTSNPPDYFNDKNYQPCKLNLYTKSIEKLDLLPTSGWAAMGLTKKDDLIVFGLSTKESIGLFTHNHTTGVSSKTPVVKTVGAPMHIIYVGK